MIALSFQHAQGRHDLHKLVAYATLIGITVGALVGWGVSAVLR